MKDSQVCENDEIYQWQYSNLLTLRNEENKHYWDSVRLILASQAGLLGIYAVTFDKLRDAYPAVICFVSLLGLIFSVFLFQIIRAGMYWVIYWQEQMVLLENKKLGQIKIFSDIPARSQGKKARQALHFGVRPVDLSLNIQALGIILVVFWLCVTAFSVKVGILADHANGVSIIPNNAVNIQNSNEKLPDTNNSDVKQNTNTDEASGTSDKNESGTIITEKKVFEPISIEMEKSNKANARAKINPRPWNWEKSHEIG